jgi:hypothetical protein
MVLEYVLARPLYHRLRNRLMYNLSPSLKQGKIHPSFDACLDDFDDWNCCSHYDRLDTAVMTLPMLDFYPLLVLESTIDIAVGVRYMRDGYA